MSMTDNIADMLTRIRNGQKSKLLNVVLPVSNLKCAVLEVLKGEGYIAVILLIPKLKKLMSSLNILVQAVLRYVKFIKCPSQGKGYIHRFLVLKVILIIWAYIFSLRQKE
jgi:ribosomal protein S8